MVFAHISMVGEGHVDYQDYIDLDDALNHACLIFSHAFASVELLAKKEDNILRYLVAMVQADCITQVDDIEPPREVFGS